MLPNVNISQGYRGFSDVPGSGDRQRNYEFYDNLSVDPRRTRDQDRIRDPAGVRVQLLQPAAVPRSVRFRRPLYRQRVRRFSSRISVANPEADEERRGGTEELALGRIPAG